MKKKQIKSEVKSKIPLKASFYQFFGGAIEITEAFFSLRSALEAAVRLRSGKKAWIQDFSNKEVVYYVYRDSGRDIDAEGEDVYYKTSYKVVKGDVELVGSPVTVNRTVKYEQLDTSAFIDLIDHEMQLKEKYTR